MFSGRSSQSLIALGDAEELSFPIYAVEAELII